MQPDDARSRNEKMIREQIVARGVRDARVLGAMRSVPRELFVPPTHRASAYDDTPLPLDRGQTISQPFIVALMTERLEVMPHHSVLEIGAGSGYQTAVLARLALVVYAAELEPVLASGIEGRLKELQITNAVVRAGDGLSVFREFVPFDRILSAAAPAEIPPQLIDQLADGGRLIIPVGAGDPQYLYLIEKSGGHVTQRRLDAVRFVPLR
jgi:protein-L-isoaspartate(D-aspartate) O-methyltransferase